MNLRSLSDDVLWQRTEALAAEERRVTLAVLYHLREIERRMLYAARGFSSLKDYCTQVLKYSESSAYRRIASMRLLREVPELEEKLKSGAITLSNAAQAQTHFHKVKKQVKRVASIDEKRMLLSKIESLSSRSCERLLGELRGDTAPAERKRPINATETEYSFTTDQETEELLNEIQRELHRTLSMRELIKEMAKITLKSLQEKRQRSEKRVGNRQGNASKAGMIGQELDTSIFDRTADTPIADVTFDAFTDKPEQPSATTPTTAKASCDATPTQESCTQRSTRPESISPVKSHTGNYLESNAPAKNRTGNHASFTPRSAKRRSRYISVSAEREVWERAEARCQYVDAKTGRRCTGTRHLQIDHVYPYALGGSNESTNLELLCANHNRFRAVYALGIQTMKVHLPSLE